MKDRKEYQRQNAAEYRKKFPIQNMYHNALNRARKKGLPFNLTKEYLEGIMTYTCPVLGIPLVFGGPSREDSPSLDRIVPELGYVVGNVIVISNKANSIKNSASASEIRKVAQWLEDNENKRQENKSDDE